ncbi:MAG: anhydro-N-acetylmuramic acid kinase [Candidatus Sulfotelmatobacter sp.]
MKKQGMIVAGVMSGTSADGINVALVRVDDGHGTSSTSSDSLSTFQLLGHAEYSYPKKVRAAVLAAMNASRASVADLARLNFLLGELYADAVLASERQFRVKAALVGCHGQTLYHQGAMQRFLGRRIAATWQTGEGAIVAARVGAPVVSDFRPSDLAAGGKGAPLVPFLDYLLFRDKHMGRIVQNIGGIANLTMIPAGGCMGDVVAFDTGPGNMVIDAVSEQLFGHPFDRGGRIAASGKILDKVIRHILRRKFFRTLPPKTAGREEFGNEFVRDFLRRCGRCRKQDVVATATALTARSISDAVRRYAVQNSRPAPKPAFHEMILSGGGTKNSTLITMLANELAPLGMRLRFSDEFGLPAVAKEAVAFALLAYETWHRRPSSIASATGAKRVAVLGKISYP